MAGKLHLLTGVGVFEELKIQIDNEKSVLRKSSAFGILLGQGASLRELDRTTAVPKEPALSAALLETDDEPRKPLGSVRSRDSGTDPPKFESFASRRSGPVPPISNFPGAWSKLPFNFWAKCVPETCRTGCSRPRIQVVTLCDQHCSPQVQDFCAPSRALGVEPGDVAASYEAGSGGWPLCVPHAYASINLLDGGCSKSAEGYTAMGAAGERRIFSVGQEAPSNGTPQQSSRFHHAAVEADDEELAVVISGAGPAAARLQGELDLPAWVRAGRLIVPRDNILNAKHLPTAEVSKRWPAEAPAAGAPFHHWVEVTCMPRDSPEQVALLLALPNNDLARRFHEALVKTPRPPRPGSTARTERDQPPQPRPAVHCELQVLAKVNLSEDAQDVERCKSAVHRVLYQALSIGPTQVQVVNASQGGGTLLGWAAVQLSGLQKALTPGASAPGAHEKFYLDV